jgi:FkbM family methyltransferase
MPDYYERDKGLMKLVPQTGTFFFDVGAADGAWALTLARGYDRTHTFEPDLRGEVFQNVCLTGLANRVSCYSLALYSHSGTLELQTFQRSVHTSVANGRGIHDPNVGQPTEHPLVAPCLTFDDHIARLLEREPRLVFPGSTIKIDVEGSELEVLMGANNFLSMFHPHLFVEIHSAQLRTLCLDYLAGFDYHCDVIRHPDYGPSHPFHNEHLWLNCRHN